MVFFFTMVDQLVHTTKSCKSLDISKTCQQKIIRRMIQINCAYMREGGFVYTIGSHYKRLLYCHCADESNHTRQNKYISPLY